jgi:trans-2,3-dihydro-3-hydroxyanthranilate isomerase
MGLDFALVDVFSDRPFGGNQLAVFPHAEGIDDRTMQALAREFNFSETTFVLPPGDPSHTCRVRIFTPYQELPFAGHPTIGTAAVLAGLDAGDQGARDDAAVREFVFDEGIGPVTVAVDGPTIRLHLRSPDYQTTDQPPPPAAVAGSLTLPEGAIAESWYAGVGLRFCFVRLAERELVDSAVLDKAAWKAGIADGWSPHLYLFAGDHRDGDSLYARSFAPAVGVDEDPATGSACASLVASLAHRSPEPDGTYRIRIDQGVAMGRPSVLDGTARKERGRLTDVAVGGHATIVGTGTMALPGAPA